MKKQDDSVRITPLHQNIFLGAVILSWFVEMVYFIHNFTRHGVYISAGTWVFQVTTWVLPVVFWGLGLWFSWKQQTAARGRVFLATFWAVAGMAAYQVLSVLEVYVRSRYFSSYVPHSGSYWAAFGDIWTVMAVSVILFGGTLFWLRKRA